MLLHVARNQVIGILRKNQVPECVQMEKVTNKGKLLAIKGTTKAAVLVGDPGCPHLVVVTVYDNVPVRFITTAHETIEWRQQWRKASSNVSNSKQSKSSRQCKIMLSTENH